MGLIKNTFRVAGYAAKTALFTGKAAYYSASAAATAGAWMAHGVSTGARLAVDLAEARGVARDGGHVVCSRGHAVATAGIFQCQSCGYAYEGSAWQCDNPLCEATTPYINCETCGLSVRSPFIARG